MVEVVSLCVVVVFYSKFVLCSGEMNNQELIISGTATSCHQSKHYPLNPRWNMCMRAGLSYPKELAHTHPHFSSILCSMQYWWWSRVLVMNDLHCKVLHWNARGLNNPARRQVIRDLIADNGCNIACVQETKLQVIDDTIVAATLGQKFVP
jgi:hypothetical protein